MAVTDGPGLRPAAQSAKRCFLNCLETSFKPSIQQITSFKPSICLPSCTAGCQLAKLSSGTARFRGRCRKLQTCQSKTSLNLLSLTCLPLHCLAGVKADHFHTFICLLVPTCPLLLMTGFPCCRQGSADTYIHTYIHTYSYIYICVWSLQCLLIRMSSFSVYTVEHAYRTKPYIRAVSQPSKATAIQAAKMHVSQH